MEPAVVVRRLPIQPRVCGDYHADVMALINDGDTTPRMRGLRATTFGVLLGSRYNPAYAGTTSPHVVTSVTCPIYPRVCGDYVEDVTRPIDSSDTTPRMRGLLLHHVQSITLPRYNPAYAGTTPY